MLYHANGNRMVSERTDADGQSSDCGPHDGILEEVGTSCADQGGRLAGEPVVVRGASKTAVLG